MSLNKKRLAVGIALLLSTSAFAQTESERLTQLVDEFFESNLIWQARNATYAGLPQIMNRYLPEVTAANDQIRIKQNQQALAALKQIDYRKLNPQAQLSYDYFAFKRQVDIEEVSFHKRLQPFNQMFGDHNDFAGFGSGQSAQPFNTYQDYINFIERSHEYVAYMDSAIVGMREGIKRDIMLPKVVVNKIIPQLKAHVVNNVEDSVFYGPISKFPEQLSGAQKKELTELYTNLIRLVIVPNYQRVHDFLTDEYLPKARTTVGYMHLPQGKAWYQAKIKKNTTLELSADTIHQFGLNEVERIISEMKKVKQTVKFDGDLTAFFEFLKNDEQFYFKNEQQVVAGYQQIRSKIDAALPKMFDIAPKADYIIKPVEAYRAQSAAGASYMPPAIDGSRPGVFYINTFNLKAQPKFLLETLSIHEAAPGHHFQISLQLEASQVPKFRQFAESTVFAEGWALYSESLGKEMGLFTDPYMWYGRLSDEQLRAMRLVVDTGMHAKGWTREQAIDFMVNNSSMAKSDIVAEVERYIAIPGQALSYKMGEKAIRDMRTKAQAALGDKFDIKAFHRLVLIDGPLPMPILAKKVDNWVKLQG